MFIIFDTETTGLPRNFKAPLSDSDNWPRAIQIAWQLHDEMGNMLEHRDFLIRPDGFDIPFDAEKIHGISTALATQNGVELDFVLKEFEEALNKVNYVVGQNIDFDLKIMGAEHFRKNIVSKLPELKILDTCTSKTAELCKIPGGKGGSWKLPKLEELYSFLFNESFAEAHNATADVEATARCFFELIRREEFTPEELDVEIQYFYDFKEVHRDLIQNYGLRHINLKEASKALVVEPADSSLSNIDKAAARARLKDVPFVHLHNHSQFTILQATTSVKQLVATAVDLKQKAVALTDNGNVMAAFHFEKEVRSYNKGQEALKKAAEESGEDFEEAQLLPIIGCEFNVCKDYLDKTVKDTGYNIVL
ncbi:MAG: PHP domain-containing protein, partial [Bacteroidetes bacterium]|nr:PHP domain-containing protein [Bacteroidota bacterium]